MKNLLLIAVFAMIYNLSFAANATMEMPFQQEPKKEKKMVWVDENGVKTEMKSSDNVLFINENGDTTKPKRMDVKVEKEIENGKEKTRVWVNGTEVNENSEEFKKYANEDGVWIGKEKGEVIIIKKEGSEDDIKVMNLEDGKKMIILKEEMEEEVIIDGEGKNEMDINVDVSEPENGKRIVKIKKKGKDGTEEVEEIIIHNMGEGEEVIKTKEGEKVIVKVKKDMDMDLGEIDPDDIEKVDVIKNEKENKIIITLKDGKVIEKVMPSEGKKEVIIIKEEEKKKKDKKKD